MTTFSDTDLLDAMMRAAFDPKPAYVGTNFDHNGQPMAVYGETPALITPLINVVKAKLDNDEAFRALLTAKIMERIDVIAERIVERALSDNSAFGVARTESGWNQSRPASYKLADWLQAPLGKALAEALTPLITEHFTEEGTLNLNNAQLNLTVEVQPWPKGEA